MFFVSHQALTLPRSVEGDKSLEKLWVRMTTRGSVVTANNYVVVVKRFTSWLGIPPDEALAKKRDWATTVNDYITDAVSKGLSSKSIETIVIGVKKWLILNGATENSDLDSVELPKIIPTVEDRTPTRGELQRILVGGNIEDKLPALIAIGSGLRVRAITNLKFKHLIGLELQDTGHLVSTRRCELNAHGHYEMVRVKIKERDLKDTREIPIIQVKAEFSKSKRAHFTFLTPECVQVLKAYVKERQIRGEELSPESYLVVNVQGKGQMDIKTVERRWRSLLARSGLDEKSETGRVRWNKLHFHMLRSFFSTQCINSGIEENVVKFFRGDRGGTLQGYYMKGESIPSEYLTIAEEKYRKVLDSLTVVSETRTVTQDTLMETFNKQYLAIAGYTAEEIAGMGDLSKLSLQKLQELVKQKSMQSLGLNGNNKQKIVPISEVKDWITQGWEYVTTLQGEEAIVRLPTSVR